MISISELLQSAATVCPAKAAALLLLLQNITDEYSTWIRHISFFTNIIAYA